VENIRLFVGIACPEAQGAEVSALMDRLAAGLSFRKWTHPDDLHVTLHFLGDTPPQRLEAISQAMEETAARFAPLVLSFTEPGIFGPPDAPRILWLGLKEHGAPGRLKMLHQMLRPGLVSAGCRLDDRPFRAHMTLARQGNSTCSPETVKAAWNSALQGEPHSGPHPIFSPWTASGITLFRSHLGRRPSYEKLRHFPFGGKD
jgi:2'-5' RNA ligase